jgi:GTP pyrophosphokinase
MAAIGYGGITTRQIAMKLAAQHEPPEIPTEVTPSRVPTSAIKVLGTGDMLVNLAQCCHPVPGDEIIGYITRSRGVTVHRQDCYNVIHEDEKERLVQVDWGQTDSVYPVNIEVLAWDKVGLIRDITTVVAEEKVSIDAINLTSHDDGTISTFITLNTKGLAQLSHLLARIEGVRGIISIARLGSEVTTKKGTPI